MTTLWKILLGGLFTSLICFSKTYAGSSYCANLIDNPGFELEAGEKKNTSLFTIEMDGHMSERSISITGNGKWCRDINGIIPHTYYLLSFWVRRDSWRDGEYPYVSLFNQELYCNELFFWGGWRRVSYILYSDDYNQTTLTFFGKGLTEKIQFDDINLQAFNIIPIRPGNEEIIKENPPEFTCAFPDDDRVYTIVIECAREKTFKHKVSFSFFSPEGSNFKAKKAFQKGRWYWRLILYHDKRQLATSPISSFRMLNTSSSVHTAINSHNDTKDDGKPIQAFFPIGIYGAQIETFNALKDAGFTLVHTNNNDTVFLNKFIASCSRAGLKALCRLPISLDAPHLSQFLRTIKGKHGLFGWYIADEPEGRGTPPSYLWKLSRYIHSLDPDHPTALVNVRSKKVWDYAPAVDIVMVDTYPVPHIPMTWLSDSIDEARNAVDDKKPVWAVIQAFNWAHMGKEYAYGKGRYPTYDEIRCLTYLSVIHGAQGLLYFSYSAARKNDPDLKNWHNVTQVVSELHTIYPVLLIPPFRDLDGQQAFSLHTTLSHVADGKGHAHDAHGNPAVHYTVKKITIDSSGNSFCLIAANVIHKEVDALFTCPSMEGFTAHLLFEDKDRSMKIAQNKLRDRFAPYEVHIYLISQTDKIKGKFSTELPIHVSGCSMPDEK
ncbi:MAG: hypothetical protein ACMUJM_06085 [bacterium]